MSSMRRLAAGAAAAVILTGALSACSSDNTSVIDVQVGDCFLMPQQGSSVTDVEVVDCAEPHDLELYHAFDVDLDGEWPGEDVIWDAGDAGCYAAYEDFVGVPYEDSELDYIYYHPTPDSWQEQDDRTIQCLIFDSADGSLDTVASVTGSLEGAAK